MRFEQFSERFFNGFCGMKIQISRVLKVWRYENLVRGLFKVFEVSNFLKIGGKKNTKKKHSKETHPALVLP